jgi:hypothetical protein
MRKQPSCPGLPNEDTGSLHVIDDFPADLPVSPEELDALEAFPDAGRK